MGWEAVGDDKSGLPSAHSFSLLSLSPPAPASPPQPREAPHVAHLSDDGLLLLTEVLLTTVLELPVQVLMYLQDLK